uniref:Uncharacterized protein n=1 Tax=Canis lupus dingo TaxID=286419 RepID=A0A8C0LNR8_CANLU
MRPSPLSSKMAFVSTVLRSSAELVLNLILILAGMLEIISWRFTSDNSPKFRTTRKTLSMPSSSLAYTTEWLSFLK